MKLTAKDIAPLDAVRAINKYGMHKIAAVLSNCPDFDIQTAIEKLSAKIYVKKAEHRIVRDGLDSYISLKKY